MRIQIFQDENSIFFPFVKALLRLLTVPLAVAPGKWKVLSAFLIYTVQIFIEIYPYNSPFSKLKGLWDEARMTTQTKIDGSVMSWLSFKP